MNTQRYASLLLRVGLAIVFLYAVVGSYLVPASWIGFFPDFLRSWFSDAVLLVGFGIYEALLGFWLLSGKKTFYAAILATITLFGIIIFNLSLMDVIFRDVGLLFAAVALAVAEYHKTRGEA